MIHPRIATFLLAASFAVVNAGCDNDSSKPKQPKVDTTPAKPALPSVDQIKADAAKAIEKGQAATANAAEKVKEAAPAVVEQTKVTTVTAADAVKAQGSELMSKLDAAIKENKLDQAQTYVDALDKIKTDLPAELNTKYEQLKTSFVAAKAKVTNTPPPPPPELNK
jgi:deoxyribodipyrimidine photolyase